MHPSRLLFLLLLLQNPWSDVASARDNLGVFSPTNLKTQYRYDDRTIASDRLMQAIHRRKSEIDGCAAVMNGEKGEYSSYYKVPGGHVAIELNVDTSGKVQNSPVVQDQMPDSRVADCVQRQVKDLAIDASGLKDSTLKKFLVLELKCKSQQISKHDSIVSTRCTGVSQVYDKITL